jgi:hypothetical protein
VVNIGLYLNSGITTYFSSFTVLTRTTSQISVLRSNRDYSPPVFLPSTLGVHSHLGQESSFSYKLWPVQHATTLHKKKMQCFVLKFCISFVCAEHCMTLASLHSVFLWHEKLHDKATFHSTVADVAFQNAKARRQPSIPTGSRTLYPSISTTRVLSPGVVSGSLPATYPYLVTTPNET